MIFDDLSFLWKNICKDIKDTIGLNGINTILDKFKILNIDNNKIIIFTYFRDVIPLFDTSTINIINNAIIKNTSKDIDIIFQTNFIPDFSVNPEKRLDNFLLNSDNRLALAVAREISNTSKNKLYTPLYLYSATAMGKTHLVNGIILEYIKNFPNNKINYYSSEDFINSHKNAIKYDMIAEWKNYNINCDLFIIEDIEKLIHSHNTINELHNIFDALFSAKNHPQIIITADSDPNELEEYSDSFKSKLQWGVKLKIMSPDKITKEKIIRNSLSNYNIYPEDDIIEYIASNSQNNIRELEGFVKTIVTHLSLLNEVISIDLINNIIGKKEINHHHHHSINGNDILYHVCNYFNITESEIKSKNRSRAVAYPRQIGMYLTKHLTNTSLQEIGKIFGGRDHSTVKHSNDKITTLCQNDINVKNTINQIIDIINNKSVYY